MQIRQTVSEEIDFKGFTKNIKMAENPNVVDYSGPVGFSVHLDPGNLVKKGILLQTKWSCSPKNYNRNQNKMLSGFTAWSFKQVSAVLYFKFLNSISSAHL